MLTVADPIIADLASVPLPEGDTRAVALPFGSGIIGEVTLITAAHFATSMEAAVPDASLVTAALPALQAAADAIETAIPLQPVLEHAGEIAPATIAEVEGDFVIVPVLENDDYVATIVVRVIDDGAYDEPVALPSITPVAAPFGPPAAIAAAHAPVPAPSGSNGVSRYEFQLLGDGSGVAGPARPLALLNDVQMELIAELGRRRMKVRDLMELELGSVIELDRAAGSPVDVLVNGALIAHGEVVVIDEEFGIRVSEIVLGDS
jgi:flagellar motor switch protein FliN